MRLNEVITQQDLEELNLKQLGKGVAAAGLAGAMALGGAGAKADAGTDQMGMSWNDMGDKVEIVQAKTDTYIKLFTLQYQKQGETITPTLQKIINSQAKDKALADYNAEFGGAGGGGGAGSGAGAEDGQNSYSRSIGTGW
jgi:hypothetical protein